MPFLESFRAARWIRLANLVCQAILFLTLFGGLNYLAGNHPSWRIDLTRYHRYSLSPETLAYLKDLGSPVRIVVTESEESASPELRGLLREYAYATEGSATAPITVQYLDIDIFRHEAEQLGLDEPDVIRVQCGDKPQTLTLDELYQVSHQERQAFAGEQAITSAILSVSRPAKKIYFLVGNGEASPDDADVRRGLTSARDQLRYRNFKVETLDLSAARRIPDDAALVVAVAPQNRYAPFVQEQLRQYLRTGAGRLILFLAPGIPPGLDDLLRDWGVTVDDDLIRDSGIENVTEEGDLIIQRFTPHPITAALIDYGIPLRVGLARTVRPDPGRAAGNGLDVVTLAATSPTAWGEVNYQLRGFVPAPASVDIRPLPTMDPPGRLGLAVAAEPVTVRDNLPFSVPRGRLVVFGTGDLIANQRFANPGVLNILLGAVNWTVDRPTQVNVPARPLERFQLSLSAAELRNLRYCLLLVLPGAAALLGLVVYWTRRS